MTRRRLAAVALMAVLLTTAAAAGWRSVAGARGDPAARLAAELRCPACQGESVAESRSPIAAAMRDAITAQLAAGRSPTQVRAWFVDRYGPEVLAMPEPRGPGLLLWAVPAIVLVAGLALAARALGRHTRPPPAPPRAAAGPLPRPDRVWNVVAFALVGLVVVVALSGPRLAAERPDAVPPDVADLALARSLEQQGRYAAAVELYREVLRGRPDDELRLRLAFALIRAGNPQEASRLAEQVLAARGDDPEALLMLGLAQRESGSPRARETLRRFLDRAPEHRAAPEIRRLVQGG